MIKFGMIKYFLKIDNKVFVAVSQFKIVGNIIDKIGGRTSNALSGIKNSGVFEQFYSNIKEIKDKCLTLKHLNSYQSV
jgi:hypothetical protein